MVITDSMRSDAAETGGLVETFWVCPGCFDPNLYRDKLCVSCGGRRPGFARWSGGQVFALLHASKRTLVEFLAAVDHIERARRNARRRSRRSEKRARVPSRDR